MLHRENLYEEVPNGMWEKWDFIFESLLNLDTLNCFYSDRLYMLERDKEKLMDRVDAANRALLDHANQTKK